MAYIELHQSLLRHPKTAALISQLQCDRYKLIGHLVSLWCWALDVADDDGKLPAGTTAAALADGAGWPIEDSARFVAAMRKCGWLEKRGWQLHDWKDYTWRYHAVRNAAALNGAFGNHKRWHADRQVVDPNCAFCRGDSGGDIASDIASDIGGDIASESHLSNSNSHSNLSNDLIDLNSRIAMKDHPLNLTNDEWQEMYRQFPGVNVQSRWREWVKWNEKSGARVEKRVAAFASFLRKKSAPSVAGAAT